MSSTTSATTTDAPAPRPSWLPETPVEPTPLGRYRLLSPHASVRVSPIQLGGMSVGTAWNSMGAMTRESSFEILDAYYEAGGNFIDTASNYQDETSEKIIGEWMELRGVRDQMVIATKYTTHWKRHDKTIKQQVHYAGNGTKALHLSVHGSLAKLRTSYIDVLYVHWYDWETGVEEMMNSLHNLVVAGKVLYLGISDTPAWFVAQANQYARDHGKTPFVVYQGQWSLAKRSLEREVLPMARRLGLALAPWEVLGAGRFLTDAEDAARTAAAAEAGSTRTSHTQDGRWERSEDDRRVAHALERVMKEVGASSVQAVAIAYHLHKTPYVFPIVGCRSVEKLRKNIEALTISLSPAQMRILEDAVPLAPEFPEWLIGDGTHHPPMLATAAPLDFWPLAEPIKPQPAERASA